MLLEKMNSKIIFGAVFLLMIGSNVCTFADNSIEVKLDKAEKVVQTAFGNNESEQVQPEADSYGAGIKKAEAFKEIDSASDRDVDADAIRFNFNHENDEAPNENSDYKNDVIIYEPEASNTRQVRVFQPSAYDLDVEATFYYYHDDWPEGSGTGITYTGNQCIPWYTIAVDPDIIPLGSRIFINGREYIADDIGGAIQGYRIDIAVNSREEAFWYGRRSLRIRVVPPGSGGQYQIIDIPADKADDLDYINSLGDDVELLD